MRHAEIAAGEVSDQVTFRPCGKPQHEGGDENRLPVGVDPHQPVTGERRDQQDRQTHQRCPDPVEQPAGDHPPGHQREADHSHDARAFRSAHAVLLDDLGHMDVRAAIGQRDAGDRQPDRPETPVAQGFGQADPGQAAACGDFRWGFLRARLAEPEPGNRQGQQQWKQRNNGIHAAPAPLADRPDRNLGHDQC